MESERLFLHSLQCILELYILAHHTARDVASELLAVIQRGMQPADDWHICPSVSLMNISKKQSEIKWRKCDMNSHVTNSQNCHQLSEQNSVEHNGWEKNHWNCIETPLANQLTIHL